MTSHSPEDYLHAIHEAQKALKAGDKTAARHWAQTAADLSPEKEDPWLVLAAVASPRASIEYLNHALQINPTSQRARKGMQWAIQRYRSAEPPAQDAPPPQPVLTTPITSKNMVRKRAAVTPWLLILLALFLGIAGWVSFPAFSPLLNGSQQRAQAQILEKATRTPDPTQTSTSLPTVAPTETIFPTATNQPTEILKPSETPTLAPSNTPEPSPTEEPEIPSEAPTEPPEPTRGPNGQGEMPDVKAGEHWIDVDLSQQRVYAYEGDQIVDSFLVSTGTAQTPTVTGKFHIYVKLRAANMSGPGYFLPDVPYVMYFFKSYGLHGTYWHSNFGHPMSHGCVNLKTKEARKLFDWASVGTLVYVHR